MLLGKLNNMEIKNNKFPKLLIFLNIFNFIDLFVTIIGINRFGLIAEGNYNVVYIISNFGIVPLIIIKLIGVLLVSLCYKINVDFIIKKAITDEQIKYTKKFIFVSEIALLLMNILFIKIIIEWVFVLV